MTPVLVILSGLPGTGKTSIARGLALRLGAVHLRIDSIEHALASAPGFTGLILDAGYRVAYALAADNLRLGRLVIADSVNPIAITRDAWRQVAAGAGARPVEIEVICSDAALHRRRVEQRQADIAGFRLPSWAQVIARDYQPWERARIVIDTGLQDLEASIDAACAAMPA